MLPYHASCRDSFHEGLSAPVVGHDVLSYRKDDYVRKANLACDLRRESIEKVSGTQRPCAIACPAFRDCRSASMRW